MKSHLKILTTKIKGHFGMPLFLLLVFMTLCSHDLYIKMETYFLKPNQQTTLSLYNGTFEKSENTITRDRILDASLVYQGNRLTIDSSQWTDKDSTITQINFTPIEEATYLAGVSTKARNIELTAEKFNDYLKHDGVLDILDQRKNDNLLDQDAVESYEKHVKAIYQVGDVRTDDWKTVLGYPIEFVPQDNPYEKFTGDTIEVQLLLDGQPLSNHLVYADYITSKPSHEHSHEHRHEHDGKKHSHKHKHDKGHDHDHEHEGKKHPHKGSGEHSHEHEHDGKKHSHKHKHNKGHDHDHKQEGKKHAHKGSGEHSHEHEHDGKKHAHKHKHDQGHDHKHDGKSKSKKGHTHTSGQKLRTNDNGMVSVNLPEDGIYFIRTIHMVNVTDSDELTHRSKWATLTFEVTHKHDESTHTHDDHDHEGEIPIWIFVLGSLLVIGVLFVVFRKKG